MTLGDGEYRLSCVLRAHEDDVRRICVCGDSGIATSSRDKTVRFWVPDPEKKHGFVLSKTLAGHTSFVGPLAWIPPGGQLPEGGVVSGGMDTLVLLWDLARGEIMEKMTGHQFQVGMLFFDSAQLDGILKKISEFNSALVTDVEKSLSLSELELSRLAAIVKVLKDTSHYHCSSFADADILLLLKLLKSWPIPIYAVLLIEAKDREGQAQVLSAALEIAEDGNQDVDGRFRALVAVGTLMLKGVVKSIAIDFDVVNIAKDAKGSKESKVAEVGADIELVINNNC
ncbi:PUL domain [Musa troglodytarum]|uniref:PUL domain n=1 Tax=Musa troglodytarum TaxID=320322 RepID=A0A9E7FT76_9LILI|nr:PUL domain [Musa troglodytarum]